MRLAVFPALGIVGDDLFQPILRSVKILVLNLKIRQSQQSLGMQLLLQRITDEILQQVLRLFRLINLPQHLGQPDVRLPIERAVRETRDQRLKLVFGLKRAVALQIEGLRHQIEGVVGLGVPLFAAEDDAAFFYGLGIFIHSLRRGASIGGQGPGLGVIEVFPGVVHRVVQAAGKTKQQDTTEQQTVFSHITMTPGAKDSVNTNPHRQILPLAADCGN